MPLRPGQEARTIPLSLISRVHSMHGALLEQLVNSSFVKISRSPDLDHFRSIEKLGDARSIPLGYENFAASFAAVTLKSCSIYLQRTFPRILQVRYSTPGAIVGFAMDDAVSVLLNGLAGQASTMLLVKGDADCDIVEPRANLIAFVAFDSIEDRGWAGERDRAQLMVTRPVEVEALRETTRRVLMLASHSPHVLVQPYMIENVEESILQAVDHAMHAAPPTGEGKRSNMAHYQLLVRRLDELLSSDVGKPLHSADMARRLGTSVRTLHNAVIAIRGMSMHRYTRVKRLWSVRQQLVRGLPIEIVKSIALANGFSHMGEFNSAYRELFGELPSQTMSASRRQPNEFS
jgi:AraC family transcriptional regulator, ethanolamine operon transcriptional activator